MVVAGCNYCQVCASGPLLFNLEAAIEEISIGLAVAWADAEGQLPSSLMELFGLEILEAYIFWSKCSKQSYYYLVTGHLLLLEFVNSMKGILVDLKRKETDLVGAVNKEIKAIEKKVRSLRCSVLLFANGCTDEEKVQNILTHLGDLAVAAAHLSYICWANKMNEKMEREIIFMISDLQRKMMPSFPEAIKIHLLFLEVYLGVLKASKPSGSGASMTVEDMVSSFLNFLLSLDWQFHMIKLVKVETKTVCLQAGGTSLFNLSNSDRVGFSYFLLGSPRELLICEADSIAYRKSEIEVVQREQEVLRAFLKDNVEHLNEHKKLMGLATGVMHIVSKAEYIIHSLAVGDSPPWCYFLWPFDVTEDIEIIDRKNVGMFAMKMLHVWVQSVAQTSKYVTLEVTTPKIGVVLSLSNQIGMIINKLENHSKKVLSIICMTGFGNTKIRHVRKVYEE